MSEQTDLRIKEIEAAMMQADFWNGDPDIDAICRMEHAPECKFDDSYFPLACNKLCNCCSHSNKQRK